MIDITVQDYSELLEKLYDGARAPSPWQDFLSSLNETLNLRACYLFLRFPTDIDSGLMFASIDEESLTPGTPSNIYNTDSLFASDPLVISSIGEVVTLDDLVDGETLEQSQFYKICMEPWNIRHTAGIDLELENRQRFSFRLSRSADQGRFTSKECEFIRMLSEHIQRAVVAGEKLVRIDSERRLWSSSLAGKTVGVVMLDETGSVVRTNAVADGYLREKDGLALVHSSIRIGNADLNKTFKAYVVESLAAQRSGEQIPINALAVVRTSGRPDYELVIRPVPIDPMIDSRASPHLSVFIYSQQQQEGTDERLLMKLYNLTPTEVSVAVRLSKGESLEEVANGLNMAINTARAHIRSIFTKTGVTQQTQLVRLVLKSLASLPGN